MTTKQSAASGTHDTKPSSSFVDINLCSGAGGLALGLSFAGLTSFQFYDRDPGACETLRHNIRKDNTLLTGRVLEGDLSSVEWLPKGKTVRLLAAGAPCQPFSMGGARKGHDDDRNLFPVIMDAVRILRPQAVLLENVRGLERGSHKEYLQYILRQLSFPQVSITAGESWMEHNERLIQHSTQGHAPPAYNVHWGVFNAADYGVPQVRHRLFVVATAPSLPQYRFPTPTHSRARLLHEQSNDVYWEKRGLVPRSCPANSSIESDGGAGDLPWVTVRDAISNLPLPETREAQANSNHWAIEGARAYGGHTGSALDWPSKTLKAGVHGVPGGENMVVCDDTSVRYYTLREMARVQSFPDSYHFVGSRSNVTRQIGNATPCDLAKAIAKPLADLLGATCEGRSA